MQRKEQVVVKGNEDHCFRLGKKSFSEEVTWIETWMSGGAGHLKIWGESILAEGIDTLRAQRWD